MTVVRGDGALDDILKLETYASVRDVMSPYTSVEWEKLCAEVAKPTSTWSAARATPMTLRRR